MRGRWRIEGMIVCMIAVASLILASTHYIQMGEAKKTKTFNLYVTLAHGTSDSGSGKINGLPQKRW